MAERDRFVSKGTYIYIHIHTYIYIYTTSLFATYGALVACKA